MSATTDHPKICVFCSADCSDVQHVRDKKGRYACVACIERNRQQGSRPVQRSRAAAAAGRDPVASPGAAVAPAPPGGVAAEADAGSGYGLAGESDGAYDVAPIPLAPPPPPLDDKLICPVCVIRMPPDLGRCAQCGYDPKVGIQSSRRIKKKATKDGARRAVCSKCGYDMTGVPATRCPECGTVVDLSRRRYDQEESRRIAVWSYLKPAIMLGVGLAGIFLVLAITGNMIAAPFYLVKLGVFVPIGVFSFFLCCLMWIGFDAPFHRVALELAGIYAFVDFVAIVLWAIVPVFIVQGVVLFFFYIALLASILDLEYGDAAIVGFVTLLIRLAVLAVIMKAFGII